MALLETSTTVGASRIQQAVPLPKRMELNLLDMFVLFDEGPFAVHAVRMRKSKHTSRNMFPEEPVEDLMKHMKYVFSFLRCNRKL